MKRSEKKLVFKLGILAFGFLLPSMIHAQGIRNSGAKIVINNNPSIYISGSTGNYTSESGGRIDNVSSDGTIILEGNWINNSANTGFSSDGSTVHFLGTSAQTISGTDSSAFYNLIFSGGNTKTISAASIVKNLVTVNSSTTLNAKGNLTLLTIDSTSNANIGPLLNGASVTGNVNIQSFYTGGASSYRGNRLISTPLADAALDSSNTYKQLQAFMFITGPGNTANGFDLGNSLAPNATTIYQYNESASKASSSQFNFTQSIWENLSPGHGTMIFYRGDRSNSTSKLNAPFATPESQTVTLSGPVNQGSYTLNLSFTDVSGESDLNGYNMAGNPYPSVIDWTRVDKDTSLVQDFIMFIKPSGGYATYLNGFSTNSGGKDLRYIQPGQGFYVRAKATGAYLSFTENSKETSIPTPARMMYKANDGLAFANSVAFVKPQKVKSAATSIRMRLQDGANTEEAVAVFQGGASSTAGTEDAAFFGGSTIALSTLSSDSKRLAINFMPDLTQVQQLKLSVDAGASKEVKLQFPDATNLSGYQVFLQDNYTNSVVDVKAQPSYTFSINKSNALSYGSERLKVLFQPQSTLPVELLSFSAQKVEKGAELRWQLANSSSSRQFSIERSEDGIRFETIGRVEQANAGQRYYFLDDSPGTGTNFYRLRMTDNNGTTHYSNIVLLNYELGNGNISVYPNPSTEKIHISGSFRDPLILTVFDISGKEIKTKAIAKNEAPELIVSDLLPGVYVLQVSNSLNQEKLGTSKFIKQ